MSAFELAWAEAALHSAKGELQETDARCGRALPPPIPFIATQMGHEDESRGECTLDYGRFLAARGDYQAAKETLGAALEIFSRRSMKPLRDEASEALRSLGA